MNPKSTTETPPHNEAVETSGNSRTSLGIEWINLMMISQHRQPDTREPTTGGRAAPQWLFRIELDLPLKDTERTELQRRLSLPNNIEDAGQYLRDIRSGLEPTTLEFIEVAFRNAASPKTPAASPTLAQDDVMVEVTEDFGKRPKHKKMARAQFDTGLPNGEDLATLRGMVSTDPAGAKDALHRKIGGRDRPKHVVTAALAND